MPQITVMPVNVKRFIFPSQTLLTLKTIITQSQAKNKYGMRYEAEWLLECLLLRIKSVATYEHIGNLKLLPLPSRSTLLRLLSGVSCHFGYSIPALEAIEKIVQGKEGKEPLAIISFDEVSLTPKPDFNTELLAFDGFANLNTDPVRNRDEIDHHDGDGPRSEPDVSETPFWLITP